MSAAVSLPHPWSEEGLHTKARLYAEQMHTHAHDDWQFVLWSALLLELLARAAVANVSPTLLAEAKDANNLLFALELEVKAAKFTPRSIDISAVVRLLQDLLHDFTPELGGFCVTHMQRRNEELHTGSSPLSNLASSTWLPTFYRACQVLLVSMNESLEDFLGTAIAKGAQEMIQASLDESAKTVGKAISEHSTLWAAKSIEEKSEGFTQATGWATKQVGHRVQCPACQCTAIVTGKAIAAPIKTIDEDEVTEVQQYLPSRFECIACGLKISGLPQLNASGLANAYKATFTYEASEYFAMDDPYAGYEPDFNDR